MQCSATVLCLSAAFEQLAQVLIFVIFWYQYVFNSLFSYFTFCTLCVVQMYILVTWDKPECNSYSVWLQDSESWKKRVCDAYTFDIDGEVLKEQQVGTSLEWCCVCRRPCNSGIASCWCAADKRCKANFLLCPHSRMHITGQAMWLYFGNSTMLANLISYGFTTFSCQHDLNEISLLATCLLPRSAVEHPHRKR